MSRPFLTLCLTALCSHNALFIASACGDDAAPIAPLPPSEAPHSAEEPPKVPDPPRTPAPEPAPGSDPSMQQPRSTLAELLEVLGDEDDPDARPSRPPTLADCITEGYEDIADVRSEMALDDGGALIILEADTEESGHSTVTLWRAAGGTERRITSFDAFGHPVRALRRRLGRYGSLSTLPNLVQSHAYAQFSLDQYAPLVGLSGPLDGWVLWHETTGIEEREERIHVSRPDGSEMHTLATRPATLGSCEPGRWCDINDTDPDAECTLEMLEAEGDLCTHPAAVYQVALIPSGKLAVLGQIIHPGHDGYTQSRWIVDLPSELAAR